VFVHGIQNAGHLLMLDNNEEFNFAVIQAANVNIDNGGGGGGGFSSRLKKTRGESGVSSSDSHLFLNEVSAALFFRGPRWNVKTEEKDDGDDSSEEKKVDS
jgi:hypothetical protein